MTGIWRAFTVVALVGVLSTGGVVQALPILDCDGPASSSNDEFFAVQAQKGKTTEVYRWVWPTRTEKIWEKPGWGCDSFLSDDGEYLVVGDSEGGQLSRNYNLDRVMLTFYRRDTVIRTVSLREIMLDVQKNALWSDCSSLWGGYAGFVGGQRFAVDTVEGRRLVYDFTTGTRIEILPSTKYETEIRLFGPAAREAAAKRAEAVLRKPAANGSHTKKRK